MPSERDPVVVASVRTAVGKAPRGALRETRPDELAAVCLRAVIEKVPGFDPATLDDVIVGCAFPEGPQGMNFARTAALRAELPVEIPAMTVNRFCSSGLQTIALAADRIRLGDADAIIAGGAESMSMVPLGGHQFLPNPSLVAEAPDSQINMGLTAERVAAQYDVSRADQDAFALRSHERAVAAIEAGHFRDEIAPVGVRQVLVGEDGSSSEEVVSFSVDEGPRRDTTAEALASLKPVFRAGGTVTAGNCSQTSDGAAATLVLSRRRAEQLGVTPLATFRGFAVAGVAPELMGIGPVAAVPKLLEKCGVSVSEIDRVELNEAFAAQAIACVREFGFDEARVNPSGGAIALGHPLGATGAKLTATLLHGLARDGGRFGVVTMCVGGGMGAAGLFERC